MECEETEIHPRKFAHTSPITNDCAKIQYGEAIQ